MSLEEQCVVWFPGRCLEFAGRDCLGEDVWLSRLAIPFLPELGRVLSRVKPSNA
jgi:hypothetical protein